MPTRALALLACCLLAAPHKGSTALQRFEQQPEYTEVNPQQDAILRCKVSNKRGFCSWQKDNKPVGMYAQKYEWAGSRESGDCSLRVRAATLEFDDGEWECQVTASDFTTQDALTSQPVRLVVRVAPQTPRVEYNGSQVLPGHNVTAPADERIAVKCVSRYGNPPAALKWFLGEEEVTGRSAQSNATELDNPRTWAATSVLELVASRRHHGRRLRCVALHESYATKSLPVDVRLDVRYAPTVKMSGVPSEDVEEGQDVVVLRCDADANPPARVVWRRDGSADVASLDSTLAFRPATRVHSGAYTCQARNDVGVSDALHAHIDVKFPPRITSVGPDRVTTAPLFSAVTFTCSAEGNPAPSVQWLQRLPTPGAVVVARAEAPRLHIPNVTYDFQGDYVCKATNFIGGRERVAQSDAVAIQVVGAPQVLRAGGGPEVVVARGQDATLRLVVCADPRPRRAAWEWGSLQLEAGSDLGRYHADELAQEEREDCYEARLHVREVDPEDSRNYYLAVENDRGADRLAVHLAVREPVPLAALLGLAAAGILALVLLVVATVYAARAQKCCFARKYSQGRGDFRPADLESEKSDVDSSAGRKTPAITCDSMYNSSPNRRPPHTITGSPEAMKNLHHMHLNTSA